ncbi:uncharacterized protein LOC133804111 [Humulus lupulus]|uniref:uncharacterized protein LOC133804111 n=1 Tax=Humulus lupulus TaxID=3486 RepID=UPI002B4077C7|nr:uncharacterized protein LOC133804111 [Humulus lupulus]
MVHTLGTNSSSWRVIKFDVLEDILNHNVKGMYCKGAYYWLYQTRNEGVILSFDMSAEIFCRIPIPYHEVQQKCNCNRERLRLGEWNQSVALFVATELNWDSSLYELWVLVDSVDKGFANTHWIKCLITGPLQPQYSPFEFWKDDELFLLADMNEFVSYNVYSQQIRKVHFRGKVIGHKFSTQCLKTLVSV